MAAKAITGIAETVKILNTIDKELVKQARKDLRSGAQPVADAVKNNIPTEAPMSGMVHNGRTAWKPSGVKVVVRTNFSKKAERRGFALVSIVAGSRGKGAQGSASFQFSDIAGRKARGNTASGRKMIQVLNNRKGKPSRFVYPAAEREIPYVKDQLVATIRTLTKRYNDSLKKVK